RPDRFMTTRWSIVLSCTDSEGGEEKAHAALAELCKIYWRPVFAFICRQGHSFPDAQDLTQTSLGALLRVYLPPGSLCPRRSGPDTGFFRDGAERPAFATGGSEPGKVPFPGAKGIAEFPARRCGQTSRPETWWRRAIRFLGRLDG